MIGMSTKRRRSPHGELLTFYRGILIKPNPCVSIEVLVLQDLGVERILNSEKWMLRNYSCVHPAPAVAIIPRNTIQRTGSRKGLRTFVWSANECVCAWWENYSVLFLRMGETNDTWAPSVGLLFRELNY